MKVSHPARHRQCHRRDDAVMSDGVHVLWMRQTLRFFAERTDSLKISHGSAFFGPSAKATHTTEISLDIAASRRENPRPPRVGSLTRRGLFLKPIIPATDNAQAAPPRLSVAAPIRGPGVAHVSRETIRVENVRVAGGPEHDVTGDGSVAMPLREGEPTTGRCCRATTTIPRNGGLLLLLPDSVGIASGRAVKCRRLLSKLTVAIPSVRLWLRDHLQVQTGTADASSLAFHVGDPRPYGGRVGPSFVRVRVSF